MKSIIENDMINQFTENYNRAPFQENELLESDSEIICLPNKSNAKIAITIDTISEEVSSGLYNDPYLIGWMSVVVNLSDLSAVGTKPLGILISEILEENQSNTFTVELHRGIKDACNKHSVFVLGGDTNFGSSLAVTGCALGMFEDAHPISRKGCSNGNLLYASGFLGGGNAFAIAQLLSKKPIHYNYFPKARVFEGQLLTSLATSCMDTSDGVISTLDELMRLNNVGFRLNTNWELALDSEAKKIAKLNDIPLWLLLAGQHGEFELLFTIEKKDENKLLELASQKNWTPIKFGEVIKKQELILPTIDKEVSIETTVVRNLASIKKNNVSAYLKSLIDIDKSFQKTF